MVSFAPSLLGRSLCTEIGGKQVKEWSLSKLVRNAATLIADITAFMTLSAGDLLLVGLPASSPRARAGERIQITSDGFSPLHVSLT
jgi:5-oxopent-3-ene-1,2,5-tricarboxylate decarboxylase/2-hydroxyhepta-2,4-diene-1,7-dioate isomerase